MRTITIATHTDGKEEILKSTAVKTAEQRAFVYGLRGKLAKGVKSVEVFELRRLARTVAEEPAPAKGPKSKVQESKVG